MRSGLVSVELVTICASELTTQPRPGSAGHSRPQLQLLCLELAIQTRSDAEDNLSLGTFQTSFVQTNAYMFNVEGKKGFRGF